MGARREEREDLLESRRALYRRVASLENVLEDCEDPTERESLVELILDTQEEIGALEEVI